MKSSSHQPSFIARSGALLLLLGMMAGWLGAGCAHDPANEAERPWGGGTTGWQNGSLPGSLYDQRR